MKIIIKRLFYNKKKLHGEDPETLRRMNYVVQNIEFCCEDMKKAMESNSEIIVYKSLGRISACPFCHRFIDVDIK